MAMADADCTCPVLSVVYDDLWWNWRVTKTCSPKERSWGVDETRWSDNGCDGSCLFEPYRRLHSQGNLSMIEPLVWVVRIKESCSLGIWSYLLVEFNAIRRLCVLSSLCSNMFGPLFSVQHMIEERKLLKLLKNELVYFKVVCRQP